MKKEIKNIDNLIEEMEVIAKALEKVVNSNFSANPDEVEGLLDEACYLSICFEQYLKKDYLIVEKELKAHGSTLDLIGRIFEYIEKIVWGYQIKKYLKLFTDAGIKLKWVH